MDLPKQDTEGMSPLTTASLLLLSLSEVRFPPMRVKLNRNRFNRGGLPEDIEDGEEEHAILGLKI